MIRRISFLIVATCVLISCGFHWQEPQRLARPLRVLYIQAPDAYGQLARSLRDYLKLSHVQLVCSRCEARTVLEILHDDTSQTLLSTSGTQQTRQYLLRVTVVFEITDSRGSVLVGPQTLSETRSLTVQSNQILGSSNEANLFYQQVRRSLAYSIINRIASNEITCQLEHDNTPRTITHL